MALNNIKLVTFDATNTLLQFRFKPWQYYAIVAARYGFKGNEDELKNDLLTSYKFVWDRYPNFGRNTIGWQDWWKYVVRKTFYNHINEQDKIMKISNQLINDFKTTRCWIAVDGGSDLINLLKSKGITVGVISNFDPRLIEILKNVGIYNLLDFVITSYTIGYCKPNEKIFEAALQMSNTEANCKECIHIGDNIVEDYDAAREAGWHGLLVTSKPYARNLPHPNHVFSSFVQLYNAISNNKINMNCEYHQWAGDY